MSDVWLIFVQLLIVGSVIVGVLTYIIRSLVCKAKYDVGNKAVLVSLFYFYIIDDAKAKCQLTTYP